MAPPPRWHQSITQPHLSPLSSPLNPSTAKATTSRPAPPRLIRILPGRPNTMVRAAFTSAAIADLCTAITAINLYYYFLNQPPAAGAAATTTSALASTSVGGDLQIFLNLFAAGGLCTAVALIYRRLPRQAAVRGGGNRRGLSDLMAFVFAAAGVLELLLFVPCGGGGDAVDVVGVIGLAAFRALPAAATATFFFGIGLIIVAHVRAGDEGGGAFAGDGMMQGRLVEQLTKIAYGAAAAIVFLMALAMYAKY